MKSLLEQKDDLLSTTSEEINNLQIKENQLFNCIDKLAADHDVIVSNTMIKITYKKALKDQNAVDSTVDSNPDSVYNNAKNKLIETPNLCNSNISFIVKSPKVIAEEGTKSLMFHSTPKKPDIEKKKKYANGVSLSPESNHSLGKNSATKVKKSHDGSPASPKKSKSNKPPTAKPELNKRFLKGDGVKLKPSIIQKNDIDIKNAKLDKKNEKKIKKLENVKKKSGIEIKKPETLKRKASTTENDSSKPKKLKLNESKQKESEDKSIKVNRTPGKRQIMLVDPDLPTGWTRFIRTKNKGSANEQYVVYVVNPQGKKFRFKWKLRKYLQRTNSSLDADQFFFGLYQRSKTSHTSITETEEEKSVTGETSAGGIDTQSEPENRTEDPHESSSDPSRSSDGREVLYHDPDLPFGWKRVIHSNSVTGRKQVHIISPDGKIFRRRYRLHEYLVKHQYTHSLDRFYFGLYPKKEDSENLGENDCQKDSKKGSTMTSEEIEGGTKVGIPNSPMYDDPNLPEGWKRFIKIRSCGESAGRMEVVIVSPDGRRHRSRKHLERYLKQKQLNYKAGDFDFTVFGRSNLKKRTPSSTSLVEDGEDEEDKEGEGDEDQELESEPESKDITFFGMKKKFTDKPVPELDINTLKETFITPEGHLIITVNGLMLCSGLSSTRSARRQRIPRKEHEKQLKSYLGSENDFSWDGCRIPRFWVERLVKCRGDFRDLEPEAATTIAETTEEFIKKLSLQALAGSDRPECGLRYEDVAEFVDKTKGLSFLKALIPKKITFREYIKLNRPKEFMSFT